MSQDITDIIFEFILITTEQDNLLICISKRLGFPDGKPNESSTQRGPLDPSNNRSYYLPIVTLYIYSDNHVIQPFHSQALYFSLK